jgi:hypothetical protein
LKPLSKKEQWSVIIAVLMTGIGFCGLITVASTATWFDECFNVCAAGGLTVSQLILASHGTRRKCKATGARTFSLAATEST